MSLKSNVTYTKEIALAKENDLKSKGFIKVTPLASLKKGQYKITTHSGNSDSFVGNTSYTIEWHE